MIILTLGHSTRSLEELIELLNTHEVRRLIDIRSMPRSRHNPQFNIDTLPAELTGRHIDYAHRKGLGGLRKPQPNSPNQGLRNRSFRAYADYMQGEEFESELEALITEAADKLSAIMCAEAVPWRCHRSLVADALTVRGIEVQHIMGKNRRQTHRLTPWAEVDGTRLTYPYTLEG